MSDIQNYKCPCCGQTLVFNSGTQQLHCDFCGNDYDMANMQALADCDAQASQPSQFNWDSYTPRTFEMAEGPELSSYTCPSCGAEISGDGAMASTICPYCGSATIIKTQFEGSFMPDFVIPFKIDKDKAVAAFEADSQKKTLLPSEFKDKKKIKEMTGIYVPFWMFDCDCNAYISYRGERITTWSDRDYDYTKTDFFRLVRAGSVGFSNIPVDASTKADDAYMDALEPFDYKEAVNFKTAYLAGYLADKYDVSTEDSIVRANNRVKVSTENIFKSTTTDYQIVNPEQTSVAFEGGKIRYSLLPVWMLNIKYDGKMYKFAINGQTGKVVGEYPIDQKKKRNYFLTRFLGSFIPLGIIAGAIAYFVF